jgi:hypothetical protein
MTCDRLVCANCAGPVSEGRCSVCRTQREHLQQQHGPFAAPSPALVALLLALAALLAFLAQRVATA